MEMRGVSREVEETTVFVVGSRAFGGCLALNWAVPLGNLGFYTTVVVVGTRGGREVVETLLDDVGRRNAQDLSGSSAYIGRKIKKRIFLGREKLSTTLPPE